MCEHYRQHVVVEGFSLFGGIRVTGYKAKP